MTSDKTTDLVLAGCGILILPRPVATRAEAQEVIDEVRRSRGLPLFDWENADNRIHLLVTNPDVSPACGRAWTKIVKILKEASAPA